MKKAVLSICFLFFISALSYASLSVGPSRLEILIEKNQVFQSTYTLVNAYDSDVDITVDVSDWNTYKGNGELDANSWIKITPSKVHLKKGEKKDITFEVKTTDSMQGSVSGMVSFSYRPPGNPGLLIKISCSVYLTIRGTQQIDFEIADVLIKKHENGFKTHVQINNNGNVHIRPSGEIVIYNKKNKPVYTAKILEYHPVYAGSSSFSVSDNMELKALKPGKYIAEILIKSLDRTVTKKVEFRLKKDGSVIQ